MKRVLAVLVAVASFFVASAQMNEIKRIPKGGNGFTASAYDRDAGFWAATEISAGYSLKSHDNVGYGEADVTFGYRFSEYFRMGPGIGIRYYFPANRIRAKSYRWAFPMYLNFRGNLQSMQYRNIVPFYSIDMGATVQDGLMWRSSLGLRIGDPRKAFTAAISYVCQEMPDNKIVNESDIKEKCTRYISLLALRLGYEF